MSLPKIGDQAEGKWGAILPALGLEKRFLTGKHGPCPFCEGKDRYRFIDKGGRGTWICNQCGAGDGVEMVKRMLKLDFKEAAREIDKHIGAAPVTTVRKGPEASKVKDDMSGMWRTSRPLDEVTATRNWWRIRAGIVPGCHDLRGHDSLSYGRDQNFPGMLAKIRDAHGNWINMHRTFLTSAGEKAPVDESRKVMALSNLGKDVGFAVRLAPIAERLGIAEGIETAIAASKLHDIPCWAALTAFGVEHWRPPEGCARVVIFGDNDTTATGQAAAWALCKRLRREGFECEVRLPESEGLDWNDMLDIARGPHARETAIA